MGMKIIGVLMAETPGSSQMYLRPYKLEWKDSYGDALQESTNGGVNLSVGAIAGTAMQMLKPSEQPIGMAQIANGMGSTRLTCTFVVELDNEGGQVRQEVLTAYTDHDGMSDNLGKMALDADMRFFFNQVGNLTINAGYGAEGYGSYQFTNATQIMTPMQGWDNSNDIPIVNRSMAACRPKDVLSRLGEGALPAAGDNLSTVLANTGYNFAATAKRSSRSNNVAPEFLSRVLTGYRDSMVSADTDDRSAPNQLQAAAESAYINEPLTASSALLTALGRRSNFKSEWSVTWKELLALDPTLVNRVTPIKMNAAYRDHSAAILHGAAGWDSTSFEAQVAQQCTMVIPASMVKFAAGAIHFIAHSETMDGSTVVRLLNARGIQQGVVLDGLTAMIEQHLAFEVYPQLNQYGRWKLYIEADIRLNGISTITVGLNSGPKVPFMAATYCDAVYTSCLSPSQQALDTLSQSLGNLAANLTANALSSGPGVIHSGTGPVRSYNYGNQAASMSLSNIQTAVPGMPGGGLGF
jgi:hypothetical protein